MIILTDRYYLTAEIADKLGNHIACYSPWAKNDELLQSGEIVKVCRQMFIRNDARCLTDNMKNRLKKLNLTNYSGMTPLAYVQKNYKLNKLYAEKHGLGEVVRMEFNTFGKNSNRPKFEVDFFRFSDEFLARVKGKATCSLCERELNQVPDYIQVSRLNYIGLY